MAVLARFLLLASAPLALATETDQFTTPRAPLHDVGPELSRKVVEIIESDRTGAAPERVLAKWAGRGLFSSRLTRWVKPGEAGFRPPLFGSIYRAVFSPAPASFFFDSPTVLVHGVYMGSDKIDHFFRQGHEFSERKESAVAHGVRQEHTYLGTWMSGVYSNADLAANYAGMKFYLNLSQAVRIGERELPPMFEKRAAGWRLSPGIDAGHLLEPFLSNHLDESLNPSRYRFNRASIRKAIRARCDNWMSFYAGRMDLHLSTWFGEDYGHWLPPRQEVSIATECLPRYDHAGGAT